MANTTPIAMGLRLAATLALVAGCSGKPAPELTSTSADAHPMTPEECWPALERASEEFHTEMIALLEADDAITGDPSVVAARSSVGAHRSEAVVIGQDGGPPPPPPPPPPGDLDGGVGGDGGSGDAGTGDPDQQQYEDTEGNTPVDQDAGTDETSGGGEGTPTEPDEPGGAPPGVNEGLWGLSSFDEAFPEWLDDQESIDIDGEAFSGDYLAGCWDLVADAPAPDYVFDPEGEYADTGMGAPVEEFCEDQPTARGVPGAATDPNNCRPRETYNCKVALLPDVTTYWASSVWQEVGNTTTCGGKWRNDAWQKFKYAPNDASDRHSQFWLFAHGGHLTGYPDVFGGHDPSCSQTSEAMNEQQRLSFVPNGKIVPRYITRWRRVGGEWVMDDWAPNDSNWEFFYGPDRAKKAARCVDGEADRGRRNLVVRASFSPTLVNHYGGRVALGLTRNSMVDFYTSGTTDYNASLSGRFICFGPGTVAVAPDGFSTAEAQGGFDINVYMSKECTTESTATAGGSVSYGRRDGGNVGLNASVSQTVACKKRENTFQDVSVGCDMQTAMGWVWMQSTEIDLWNYTETCRTGAGDHPCPSIAFQFPNGNPIPPLSIGFYFNELTARAISSSGADGLAAMGRTGTAYFKRGSPDRSEAWGQRDALRQFQWNTGTCGLYEALAAGRIGRAYPDTEMICGWSGQREDVATRRMLPVDGVHYQYDGPHWTWDPKVKKTAGWNCTQNDQCLSNRCVMNECQ
ncbi:MAG TPA: hypothetical protein VK698_36070 [Kofleriaceae bacterium]|nr:hypothetical protein [Kofleriaceae bacterium]